MNFSIYGSLFLIVILLIQLFAYYVYGFNLKIKYQKIKIQYYESVLTKIKSALSNKYNCNFKISLNTHFFKQNFNSSKKVIYLNEQFLDSNIYSLVNIVFLWKITQFTQIQDQKIELFFKIIGLVSLTASWILLMFGLWIFSILFLLIFLFVIAIDYLMNYKIYKHVYIQTKNYLIENYHNQHLNFILAYLKYKKFYILNKYLTFYIQIISQSVKAFKNWGKDE